MSDKTEPPTQIIKEETHTFTTTVTPVSERIEALHGKVDTLLTTNAEHGQMLRTIVRMGEGVKEIALNTGKMADVMQQSMIREEHHVDLISGKRQVSLSSHIVQIVVLTIALLLVVIAFTQTRLIARYGDSLFQAGSTSLTGEDKK